MDSDAPTPWRDTHGKTLQDYPRPSVAVDTAVLTVTEPSDGSWRGLCVLLTRREADDDVGWGLPGTFLHVDERLADAVLRSLRVKAGVVGLAPRQLQVFDDPARDPRGWVLSVGHMDVVPEVRLAQVMDASERVLLVPVVDVIDRTQNLPFDHRAIVLEAVGRLREEYASSPDPRRLLPEPFTLRQLEELHRAIDSDTEPKDTFRRRVIDHLQATGDLSSGTVGKPARLFEHR